MFKKDQRDEESVPLWLGQLQFDPQTGKFKQQESTPKVRPSVKADSFTAQEGSERLSLNIRTRLIRTG